MLRREEGIIKKIWVSASTHEWSHLGILTVSLHTTDFWAFFLRCVPVCKPFLCPHEDKHPTFSFLQNLTSFCYFVWLQQLEQILHKRSKYFKALYSMLAFKHMSARSESSLFRYFGHIAFAFLCLLLLLIKATWRAAGVSERVLQVHTQLPAVSCTHSCPITGRYGMVPEAQPPVTTCFNN